MFSISRRRHRECGHPGVAQGFTLIELIAVIVILAVLAVFAASRYQDIRQDALAAANRATYMAFREGLIQSKAAWSVRSPGTGALRNLPGYRDATVDFSAYGYLLGTTATGDDGSQLSPARCVEFWNLALGPTPTVVDGNATGLFGGGAAPAGVTYAATGSGAYCMYVKLDRTGRIPYISGLMDDFVDVIYFCNAPSSCRGGPPTSTSIAGWDPERTIQLP